MYEEMDFEVILDWECILKVPMLYLFSIDRKGWGLLSHS